MDNKDLYRVAVSGFFDPLTIAHIRYFKEASKLGDLIVILNGDKAAIRKKGYVFMPLKERKEIIESIKYVDSVFPCIDLDNTVCKTLEVLRPDIFAKGGDRVMGNVPEEAICKEIGIKIIYGVGGENKLQSSSWLIEAAVQKINRLRKEK